MKPHKPELISALIDGELKGLRLWLAKRHVSRCDSCAAEYREIQRVREMLTANPVQPQMSDSPEFFWSKVKREIQADAAKKSVVPMPELSLSDWLDQRREALAGVAAVGVAVLAFLIVMTLPRSGNNKKFARLATAMPQTSATAFDTDDGDDTVIWVTGLPWTKDMTEMQTVFATPTS